MEAQRGEVEKPEVQRLVGKSRAAIGPTKLRTSQRVPVWRSRKQIADQAAREAERGAITETLRMTRGNKSEAARTFGMSRPTFYKLIEENHPAVHQVLEIPYDDIVREYAACAGNAQALSRKLGVPAEVLLSRLRAVDTPGQR